MPDDTQNQDNQVPGQMPDNTPAPENAPAPAAWQWDAAVPEGIRTKFKDPNALAKSYAHLESSLGSRVNLPGETATEEEKAAFYNRLGRPESPEGYEPYKTPEGMAWDKEGEKRFYSEAHKAGLTKAQAKAVLDYYVQETTGSLQKLAATAQANQQATIQKLKETWGPNYDKNIALAQQTVVTLGDNDLKTLLDDTGMGDHPAVLRFLARVGEGLVEDGILKPELIGKSADAARDEANKLMAEKAYYDREHPDHKRTVEKVRELFRIMYPTT